MHSINIGKNTLQDARPWLQTISHEAGRIYVDTARIKLGNRKIIKIILNCIYHPLHPQHLIK